ncbi:MAG TPA: DedA family protein [Zeimonas sp.]|jgi:membrane-associated protein|nr:DedA family protein [Zeimonas sp.]
MDPAQLLDVFLHLDRHLAAVVEQYGVWVYAILFAIVFVETGLVVMPFLPGDSLLFVAGTIAAVGGLDIGALVVLLIVAAVLGDAVNYSVGHWFGPKVFGWEQSRFFNRAAFDRTHAFYERHGPMTIVVARFLPFVRTFAPFVAGVARMSYPRFALYNVLGGTLWVAGLSTIGYLFGNTAWVKEHFEWVTLAMIVIPGLPAVFEVSRHMLRTRRERRARLPAGRSTPG